MNTKTKAKSHETVIDKTTGEPSKNVTAATTDTGQVPNDAAAAGAAALDAMLGENPGAAPDAIHITNTAPVEGMPEAKAPPAHQNDVGAARSDFPTLRVKKLDPAAQIPAYQSAGAACFDLHATTPGHVAAGGTRTFSTGLAFEVPEGFVMLIYSRSGHGFKNNVRLSNCTGVIDSDYRGEILVALTSDHRNGDLEINVGDRIAQALLMPAPQWDLVEVTELSETVRGAKGYGSTGA